MVHVPMLLSTGAPKGPILAARQADQEPGQQEHVAEQQPMPGSSERSSAMCVSLAAVPTALATLAFPKGGDPSQPNAICSLADVPEWCAAACAALRTLPLCAAPAEVVQQAGGGPVSTAAHLEDTPADLASRCMLVAVSVLSACVTCVRDAVGPRNAPAEAAQAAHDALWHLHSSYCRLVHWAASGGARHLPALQQQRLGLLNILASTLELCGLLAAYCFPQELQEWAFTPGSQFPPLGCVGLPAVGNTACAAALGHV